MNGPRSVPSPKQYNLHVGRTAPSRTTIKNVGCFGFLVYLVLATLIVLLWGGLAVGAANSWILEGNFVDAWHAWWGRWPISFGWSILFLGAVRGGR